MANLLYNSAVLPPLPEYDESVYTHACIRKDGTTDTYDLFICKNTIIRNMVLEVLNGGEFIRYGVSFEEAATAEEWTAKGSGSGDIGINMYVYPIIWANADIMNDDGTLYLAASEPAQPSEAGDAAAVFDRLTFLSGLAAGLCGRGVPAFEAQTKTAISWNGDTAGLVTSSIGLIYKVSNLAPTKEEVETLEADGTVRAYRISEDILMEFSGALIYAAGCYVCSEANHTLETPGVNFPETGIYFARDEQFYVTKLSYGEGDSFSVGYLAGVELRRKRVTD